MLPILRAHGTAARACRRGDRAGRAGDETLVSHDDDGTLSPVRRCRWVNVNLWQSSEPRSSYRFNYIVRRYAVRSPHRVQ